MKTDYPGIDYGLGQVNTDKETGIRYGIIAQASLMPEALDDIYTHGRDLGCEQAEQELKSKLRNALEDYFSDYASDGKATRLDMAVDDAFDSLDGWADNLDSSGPYAYEQTDESVQTTDRGELWVFKSIYYTFAQFCSPCVPGAGNLDSPCESGVKTYCLGHDWFDDSKAPYPVYRVSDDTLVEPEKKS